MNPSRRTAIAAVLVGLSVIAVIVLGEVLGTVVLAVTVSYVLLPVRETLRDRGLSRQVSAVVTTALTAAVTLGLIAPVAFVLYRRRGALFELLQVFPDQIDVVVAGFSIAIQTEPLVERARMVATALAISTLQAAPVLALKLILFVLLVYGLLYRPQAVRSAILELVPSEYHDLLAALHRRTAMTLRAIYGLQAVTAVGTFLLALVIFAILGYESPVALAVVAGVLQFIPILGPSIVVVGLAGLDILAGNTVRAVIVFVVGLFVIGFLPDAVIRTQFADYAADLPASLYFIGFVGGVLTVGAIGVIIGPLVVALLVETANLLSQRSLAEG